MRSQQQTRKIQNNVMKSPSPDIANRNIIKDTKTPIQDVKRYLQKSSQSRSPRVSELSQSAKFRNDNSQLQYLRQRVKQLQMKNMQIMAQNQQLRRNLQQKANLEQQIYRMRQTIKSYGSSQVVTPKSQDKGSNQVIKQMQERVVKLLGQNTRIGNILQEKENQIKNLLNDINKNQSQIEYWKNQSLNQRSSFSNSPTQPNSVPNSLQSQAQDTNMIKNYYQGRIQPQMRRSQSQWLNKLRELSQRMNRIQDSQKYIQRQVARRSSNNSNNSNAINTINNTVTPIKGYEKQQISNKRTEDPTDYSAGITLPQSVKPFETMTMRSTNKQSNDFYRPTQRYDDSIVRQLQAKCGRLQRDNQGQRKRIFQLQDQLKKSKDLSNNYRSQIQPIEQYIKKIHELEDLLDSKNIAMNNGDRQLKSLREDYNRLKQRTQRQIYLLQNQRNTCKKAFQQQKQKSLQTDDAYAKLNQRNAILQAKLKQNQNFNQKARQLKAQYDNKQAKIKEYYEELLKSKDRLVGEQLHQYLLTLNNIRKDIQNSNFQQVISQSQSITNERVTIQKQINYIKQENQRIIQDLKTRLIQQQQRIIQLEKDNQLLQTQIHELEIQKQKLKKAMFQFDVFRPINVNAPNLVTNTTTTSSYKSQSACKLKNCLKETIKKIDSLEHQITQILME